jgi:hypothetical protein
MYGSMDQRSICFSLVVKGLSAQAFHSKLDTMVSPDAVGYLTVTNCRRQRQFPSVPGNPSDESPRTVIDTTILSALEKQRFSSIRELAKLPCIPTTAVHPHSTGSLMLVAKHLRWVLHTVADTQKAHRLTLSEKLPRKLCLIKHQA